MDIVARFVDAMIAAGIYPEFPRGVNLVADGTLQRFHVKGDSKGTRNGWAVLFADGIPAGEFGNWKTGYREPWCAKSRTEMSVDEQREVQARIEAARAKREAEQKAREGEAAKLANLLWQQATDVHGDAHPYLARKGIRSHGLRSTAWPVRNGEGKIIRHIDGALLVPVMGINGKIFSLQAIFPAIDEHFGRDKHFMKDGRKRAGFYMIGRPPQAAGNVVVCEGYATGATIFEATGWCVLVAFDAYNLAPVAEAAREAMPHATFVIAGDNDRWTTTPVENPGAACAKQAAAACGGRAVLPEFEDLEGRPTDFNDLAAREGIEAVQAQLQPPALAPPSVVVPPGAKADGAVALRYSVEPIEVGAVDTFTPFPDVGGKGAPLCTITNVQEMLRRLGVVVRYNVIAKTPEILIPGGQIYGDNRMNVSTAILHSWCERFRLPTGKFDGALLACADHNLYNPVKTWIESRPWDGTTRLAAFYATVTEKTGRMGPDGKTSLKDVLMRKWLISAVAAAFSPDGVVARGVLTFVSEQNLGKTHWAKRLAPPELGVVADGLLLDPANKDSVFLAVKNWIVELGEVDATFRKADIAALKAFVSKSKDELRRPYARAESEFARRTVFVASVNDENYLHDPTGNTRWWTIHATALDNAHTIDMQQLWAEVLTLYQAGETWHLTREELNILNAHNREHESINPVHELIERAFDWDSMRTLWTIPMRATEIAMAAGIERPTKADVNVAAAYVMRQFGVVKTQHGKERSTVWMMPAKATSRERAPL
jgi:putative DNA primase/helicase